MGCRFLQTRPSLSFQPLWSNTPTPLLRCYRPFYYPRTPSPMLVDPLYPRSTFVVPCFSVSLPHAVSLYLCVIFVHLFQ